MFKKESKRNGVIAGRGSYKRHAASQQGGHAAADNKLRQPGGFDTEEVIQFYEERNKSEIRDAHKIITFYLQQALSAWFWRSPPLASPKCSPMAEKFPASLIARLR